VNWETLYCPHRNCRCSGQPCTAGLLVNNGSSDGAPQARGNACRGSVALRSGTASYGWPADRALFEMAVRALAEGKALRATARLVQGDTDTVWAGRDRVARHWRTVLLSLWHNLPGRACQLDEVWRCVHPKEAPRPGAKLYGATYGAAWGWSALAPVWRVGLAHR
jgi:hypothetical protein